MNNQTDVSIKFKNYVEGEKKLEKYAQMLAQIKSLSQGIDTANLKSIDKNANTVAKDINKIAKNTDRAFNYTAVREFTRAIGRLTTAYGKAIDKSTEYLENINLYQVAFDGNTKSADRFINTMSEMYGLDESWLTRTVGIFKQLSNAMGVSAETGERLSTLLTQMSLDIASLYNVDMERASSVLQSAMAGQTKPIRGLTGGDITQATLQTTLDTLGIEKSITDLSFAEKRLIIIVSLTQQLNESIGDMGRTIESPANQIRVMNSQWDRMTRAIGNVLLPLISSILPYVNAILMVITEVLNTIAVFVGFSEDDYDFFTGVNESILEIEENLDNTNNSVKKLKQGLRGFDKLNVINTPTKVSTVGTGTGNIDKDIMDAFNDAYDEYLEKLEKTEMKATKIRDAIMEWLGFTKEIDPLTGEISWKYGGIEKTLGNMYDSFKKLPVEVKLLAGAFALLSIAKLIRNFGKLIGKITGLDKIFASISKEAKKVAKETGNTSGSIKAGLNNWSKQLTATQKLTNAFTGSVGLLVGIISIKEGMKELTEQNQLTAESFLMLSSGIAETTTSGALLGATFGGTTGAIIGGTTGLIIGLTTALTNLGTETDYYSERLTNALTPVQEYTKSIQEQRDAIIENAQQQSLTTGIHQALLDELTQIVDENGKVKKGYEDRANFIVTTLAEAYGIEIEIIDGQVKKWQDLETQIQKVIDKKRIETAMTMAEESYNLAISNRSTAYQNMTTAHQLYLDELAKQKEMDDKIKTSWDNLDDAEKLVIGDRKIYEEMLKESLGYDTQVKNVERTKKAYEEAQEEYDNLNEDILAYSGFVEAQVKEDSEAVDYYVNKYLSSYGKESDNYKQRVREAKASYDSIMRIANEQGIEITKEVETQANEQYRIIADALVREVKTTENMTDDYVEAWGTLAENSETTFLKYFEKLPEDMQKEVVDQMYDKGYSISEELQKGINEINPEIEFEADTSKVKKSLLKLLSTMKNNPLLKLSDEDYNKSVSEIRALELAGGGMPRVGQIFVANEQGPELVSHIGGKTFVANQNQMMDLLDKKLGQAQGTGQKVFNFYLDEGHKIATYTLDQLEEMAISNGKPIKIGG